MTCHLCRLCRHGRNCLNGRWCEVWREYVEYRDINECKNYEV